MSCYYVCYLYFGLYILYKHPNTQTWFFIKFYIVCVNHFILCSWASSSLPLTQQMLIVYIYIFACSILGRIGWQQFRDRNGLASSVPQHQQPWLWWFLWLIFLFCELTLSSVFFFNEQLKCLKEMLFYYRKTNKNLHWGMSATFHENKKEPSSLLWPKTVKDFQNMSVLTLLESL